MDFTGDGINDILSGCYWSQDENRPSGNSQAGYLMILAGTDEGDFEEAIPLTNSDGDPLLNVPLTKEQEENYDTNNIEWSNICTAQHAVDYDGDGDLDLVTGGMRNSFFVFINSADDQSKPPVFGSSAKRLPIESPDMHSDPHLCDWDGDGDLDLLTGGDTGSVYLSINEGTRNEPDWSEFTRLVRGSRQYHQTTENGQKIEPGRASRVWVTDHNRDGRLDLIVGDNTTIQNKPDGMTQAEADRLKAAHQKKCQAVNAKMNEVRTKYVQRLQEFAKNGEKEKAEQLIEKMQKELEPFSQQYSEQYQERSKFIDETSTGHVWVYLQQETTSAAPEDNQQTVSSESANDQEPDRPL